MKLVATEKIYNFTVTMLQSKVITEERNVNTVWHDGKMVHIA